MLSFLLQTAATVEYERKECLTMPLEQKVHDMVIAFVNYKLNLEIPDTDATHDEASFFEMYKDAYNHFF